MTLDRISQGCKKDYKGEHYWQYLGWDGKDHVAFKCSQCGKCIREKLEWLEG